METAKVAKLLPKLRYLVTRLERHRDLVVHGQVNQFYYMQKSEELRLLLEQAEEAQHKLDATLHRVGKKYEEVFHHWQKDARWLNMHLRNCEQ